MGLFGFQYSEWKMEGEVNVDHTAGRPGNADEINLGSQGEETQ